MGTRHYQTVIDKKGVTKVAQYGQWNGYPNGQGKDILTYLKSGNLEAYQKHLDALREPTKKECKVIDADPNWNKTYPYLSRDCGSKIHQMIEEGIVKFVGLMDTEEADKWCEGFYTIDFSKNEFTSEYHGTKSVFPIDNLPTEEEYLKAMESKEEE